MRRVCRNGGRSVRWYVVGVLCALVLSMYGQAAGLVVAADSNTAPPPIATAAAPPADPTSLAETPFTPRPGVPMRLQIPKINVDAGIEQVANDANGAMDTPKSFANAAWYQPGFRAGEPGNAVLAGHVDSFTGRAVFWDLRKLSAGDEIFVVGDDGVSRRFLVTGWETYPYANIPLDRIFGASTSAHLNLITCDQNSTFDRAVHSYDSGLVVYADAAP